MKDDMVIELKDDTRESRNTIMIENVGINGIDFEAELEFWPIQHPSEPSHEDRPVQCPMPRSSHLIKVSLFPYVHELYAKMSPKSMVLCLALLFV